MKRYMKIITIVLVALLAVSFGGAVYAEEEAPPQKTDPITGEQLESRDMYVDAAGYRFYVNSEESKAKVKADPKGALHALLKRDEKPQIRLVLCPECGEIKGTSRWNVAEKARKDRETGLVLDSPGYRLYIAGYGTDDWPPKKEILLDPETGLLMGQEIKSTDTVDPFSGLVEGSPGFNRIPELDLVGVGTDYYEVKGKPDDQVNLQE